MLMITTVICRPNSSCIIDDCENTLLRVDLFHSLTADLTAYRQTAGRAKRRKET